MRRIINSTYVTLDGVIQNPQDWPRLGSFDDTGYGVQLQLVDQCDAVLMGRLTYESFAPVWTSLPSSPLVDRMNAVSKYVVSSRLTGPAWTNTTVIASDPLGAIRELKDQPGADIVQYGFGPLARDLVAEGLLDELRLWVHPFMLGTGSPEDLLHHAGAQGSFTLVDVQTLDNGTFILRFDAVTGAGD